MESVKPFGLGNKEALRCKNMWTLGLALWLFDRTRQPIIDWLHAKFAKNPDLAEANIAALNAGHAYGETAELAVPIKQLHVAPASQPEGLYRTVTGAESISLGLVAGAQLAGLPMFFGGYPITPASAILHHLSRLKEYGRHHLPGGGRDRRHRIGDRRLLCGTAWRHLLVGPRIALKGEAMGLAIMTELPLVIINSQRGGPSTGLPTKTEQSDLYQAVYGRNGDSPLAVIAARSPADAFDCAIEACRIATQYMVPVILLTDGYIANAAEPWRVPDMARYAPFPVQFMSEAQEGGLKPYARDEKLKRPWIKPGTPGLMHRIGGIEKEVNTGHINYAAANHQAMTEIRRDKVLGIAKGIRQEVALGSESGKLVVVGWGSTFGPIHQAVRRARAKGLDVSHVHVRHIWPLPENLGDLLKGYEKILVPEMNTGQFKTVLRDQYLVDARPLNKISGQPFRIAEIEAAIEGMLA